jgi:hypothetical protein
MTAEEIFSSPIFYVLLALVAFFIIQPLIQLKKLMTGGKKRSKHLY